MAEFDQRVKDLLADQQFEIRKAFQELERRWRGIFDQETLRWSLVEKEWKLTKGQDGRLTQEAYPKPLQRMIADFQQATKDMREATETRLPWEAYAGQGSYMSGPPPEKQTHDWMPERGTVAYVEWVVREAIRTGYEEGYPLRANQIESIRSDVWAQEMGQSGSIQSLQERLEALKAEAPSHSQSHKQEIHL
jgi:hypothetical protein